MLKEFAEPILATNLPVGPVRSPRNFRLGVAGLGLATALALGLMVLPGNSDAATLHRIETAISNAKTMIVTSSKTDQNGKPLVYNRVWYKQGRWRSVGFIGTPIEKTFIVRDGEQFIYTPDHHTLTEEPAGPWNGPIGKLSALEFAKMETDIGEISDERTLSVEPHDPVDGRATYLVVMKRKGSDYRSEILVDKATDLPIRSQTKVTYDMDGTKTDQVQDFQFGAPIPDSQFDPKTLGLPIMNLTALQDELLRDWAKPVASYQDCVIRNVWQNLDGEVYVVYSRPKTSGCHPMRLTNSVGTNYLHVDDIEPGQIRGDTSVREHFKFDESSVTRIAVWVPLEKPEGLPPKVSVGFTGGASVAGEKPVEVAIPVQDTGVLPGNFPPYTDTLVLRDYAEQLAIHLATARAQWYKSHNDPTNELVWRRNAYARAMEWLPGIAKREYKPVVERLEHELGVEKP